MRDRLADSDLAGSAVTVSGHIRGHCACACEEFVLDNRSGAGPWRGNAAAADACGHGTRGIPECSTWACGGSSEGGIGPKHRVELAFNCGLVRIGALPSALKRPNRHLRCTDANGGVYSVPVHLNGVLRLDLVLDTGAAFVMIPADVALTLKRTGTLTIAQQGDAQDFELADGSVVQQRRVVLCSLQIGSQRLRDVEAIIGGLRSPLLLGQSALRRLEPWRLDTHSGRLILMEEDRNSASVPARDKTESACAAKDVAG